MLNVNDNVETTHEMIELDGIWLEWPEMSWDVPEVPRAEQTSVTNVTSDLAHSATVISKVRRRDTTHYQD